MRELVPDKTVAMHQGCLNCSQYPAVPHTRCTTPCLTRDPIMGHTDFSLYKIVAAVNGICAHLVQDKVLLCF
jgi:hypothetical protein